MKLMWVLIAIAAILVVGYFWTGAFSSTRYMSSGDITVSPGSDVDGDLIAAGRNVNVQEKIEGDLTAAGTNIMVAEPVEGYVMAAGSKVNINGAVGNDLWAAGSQVSVNAPVADNARLAGSSVVLEPPATVGRDAYLAGARVEVLGRVERDLKVGAASFKLASEVGGSVQASASTVEVLPGAVVRGDLIVTGPNAPKITPGAQVLGRIVHHAEAGSRGWGWLSWLVWWMGMFLATLILGAVAIAFSRRWTGRVAEKLARHFGYSLLAGIIGLIVIPLVCLLLAVTVIGIPLALVLFALYCVALSLSGVFVSYLVGGWLLGRLRQTETSPYARLATGALVVSFLASLPWIGWVVQILVLMIGFGALILERKDSRQQALAESLP
jgi:hypothetical protein